VRRFTVILSLVAFLLGGGRGIFAAGVYTTLDVPGAESTQAYGIDGSDLVGVFQDTSLNKHGFLYDGTTWTTLDAPGATSTAAYDIDGSNIVGAFSDASGGHGFLYDGTTWITLDAPGAESTQAYGIDGSDIVGVFQDTSLNVTLHPSATISSGSGGSVPVWTYVRKAFATTLMGLWPRSFSVR